MRNWLGDVSEGAAWGVSWQCLIADCCGGWAEGVGWGVATVLPVLTVSIGSVGFDVALVNLVGCWWGYVPWPTQAKSSKQASSLDIEMTNTESYQIVEARGIVRLVFLFSDKSC